MIKAKIVYLKVPNLQTNEKREKIFESIQTINNF